MPRFVPALLFCIFVTLISHTDSRTLSSDPPTEFDLDTLLSSSSSSSEASTENNEHVNVIHPNDAEMVREQAMEKLFQVFGLENTTLRANEVGSRRMVDGGSERQARPKIPPYMLNLYNSVADSTSGITRTPNPYHANTVRAFQDRGKNLPQISILL